MATRRKTSTPTAGKVVKTIDRAHAGIRIEYVKPDEGPLERRVRKLTDAERAELAGTPAEDAEAGA